jgi:hypothetical protein
MLAKDNFAAKPNFAVSSTGVQSDYLIKTKFLGEISIEKCMAFVHDMLMLSSLPGA